MSGLYVICGAAFGASAVMFATDGWWSLLAIVAAIVVIIASSHEYEHRP